MVEKRRTLRATSSRAGKEQLVSLGDKLRAKQKSIAPF
jgi:hypothetical protein